MKTAKPIIQKQKYEKAIEKKIFDLLQVKIFKPLFESISDLPKAAFNAKATPNDSLKTAIRTGSIIYEDEHFKGSFSARVSKALKDLGAQWVPHRKAWKIAADKVPADVRGEISKARMQAAETLDQINIILDNASSQYKVVDLSEEINAILEDLADQMQNTIGSVVTIPMSIEGYVLEKIREEYLESTQLEIKGWYDEQIARLRKKVQANSVSGFRASNLVEMIEAEYGVSHNKAKFLARQETTLFTSKYRKAQYMESGLSEYVWSTSMDRRVRKEHRVMQGKRCRWDNPNVYWDGKGWADRGNIGGVKKHPGEDWQCRCIAKPVIPELKEE